MLDFSAFDSILDCVFVVDTDGKIVYCNDPGATFCQSSVRRLVGKQKLSDLMSVQAEGVFPFNENSPGRTEPCPYMETVFTIAKDGKTGKAQMSVRPMDDQNWAFFIRDVSLEEALHSKYRSELSQKEEYARNLEKLVEARTQELALVNQTLQAILNSLGQGFFTFNSEGECGNVFTKACEEILEGLPKGRKAWEVLGVPGGELDQFKKWSESVFNEFLPFEDMKGLGPNLYNHSQNRRVVLDYFPIRREADKISDVVVVATDKTAEFEAQKALEAEKQFAAMIVKYMKNKEQFLQFLSSVRQAFGPLMTMANESMSAEKISESFRVLHTLEGEAGTFSVSELKSASRVSQHILEPFKGKASISGEPLKSYAESLVAMKNQFEEFLKENNEIFNVPEGDVARSVEVSLPALTEFLNELEKNPSNKELSLRFQDKFLKVSLGSCLKYFDGLVQGVAERVGKKVKPLIIEDSGLRIYPEPYQKIFSGLVHAFRNAVDHGLETPDEREWGGKDPAGQIKVFAEFKDGFFHMDISDDGKGIDPSIIREKLKAKYPNEDFVQQSDDEIIQRVCMPGFSSRESVGEFSGRGVGLDALREEVLKAGGTLHIKSKVGEGTIIHLEFPEVISQPVQLRSA